MKPHLLAAVEDDVEMRCCGSLDLGCREPSTQHSKLLLSAREVSCVRLEANEPNKLVCKALGRLKGIKRQQIMDSTLRNKDLVVIESMLPVGLSNAKKKKSTCKLNKQTL